MLYSALYQRSLVNCLVFLSSFLCAVSFVHSAELPCNAIDSISSNRPLSFVEPQVQDIGLTEVDAKIGLTKNWEKLTALFEGIQRDLTARTAIALAHLTLGKINLASFTKTKKQHIETIISLSQSINTLTTPEEIQSFYEGNVLITRDTLEDYYRISYPYMTEETPREKVQWQKKLQAAETKLAEAAVAQLSDPMQFKTAQAKRDEAKAELDRIGAHDKLFDHIEKVSKL